MLHECQEASESFFSPSHHIFVPSLSTQPLSHLLFHSSALFLLPCVFSPPFIHGSDSSLYISILHSSASSSCHSFLHNFLLSLLFYSPLFLYLFAESALAPFLYISLCPSSPHHLPPPHSISLLPTFLCVCGVPLSLPFRVL